MKSLQPQLRHLLFLFLLGLVFPAFSQSNVETEGKKINIKHADTGILKRGTGKSRLIGNVIFEHEGALMYCDSAWLFSKTNKLKAFQNVKLNQGDTIFLWGDYLEYDGNTKLAKVTGDEVKLKDSKMELVTTELDYDRKTNLAFYYNHGTIISDENLLVSKQGFYNTTYKTFNFKDSVILTNPDYVIETDTMLYDSQTRFSYFLGPTTITSDSSFIYCENGVYNTVQDIAQFEKNAKLYDDNKYLTGDSLYYEKATEFGEAFGNVFIHDTIDDYIITGGYSRYHGNSDSTFVTQEPVYSIIQEEDTLHIHGDTLFSVMVKPDSIPEYRQVKVFHKVKFFKRDLQGKCDSLSYATLDSMFRMYYSPVLWSDSSQIVGDTIYLTMRNEQLDSMKVYSKAFIINQIDVDFYNQIKGRKMFGKFYDNELKRVFVNGNGETIYYPKDEQKKYIGMNKSICSNILIKFKDNDVETITFLKKPEADLFPLEKLTGDLKFFEGFNPRFDERPLSKMDLFQ